MQEQGFAIRTFEVHSIVNTGVSAARADPGWVKLKGTGAMLVDKKILTAEESAEYQKRYIEAAETQGLLTLGFVMLQVAQKV